MFAISLYKNFRNMFAHFKTNLKMVHIKRSPKKIIVLLIIHLCALKIKIY